MAAVQFSTAKDILRFEGTDKRAYWKRFAMLLSLSVVIATMGLVRNSGAVVIAAMLIAPLMTPILGIAASMVVGRNGRVLNLLGAVIVAALLSVGLAWTIVFIADVPTGITLPDQVMSRTDPGTEDLIVALAAGIAGAYVQINRNEVSLLPGAAIGVALVPPLSAAGILLYHQNYADALDACLLFSTNLAAIVLAACAVYIFSGAQSTLMRKSKRRKQFTLSFAVTLLALGFIVTQLMSATYQRYSETRAEAELMRVVKDWADPVSVEIVRIDVDHLRKTADLWIIVDLPLQLQTRVASIADLLPDHLKDQQLPDRFRAVLGPDYAVAFRFQTRLAGLVFLSTEFVIDAPSPDETDE